MNNKILFTIIGLMPLTAYAEETENIDTSLAQVSSFGELISVIWSYGSEIIIALAAFFLVLGAFFYIASAGNDERISQGKEMVFGSLVAIVITVLSGALIRLLHKPTEGSTGALADIPNTITNGTNILIGFIGAFTIAMLIYAGFLYMTARGDEMRIDKAHDAIRYAFYGLILGVLAYAVVNTVIQFLI